MVDEVPFPVVLDGAEAAAEKVHVHGPQHRLQQPEDGIVGGVNTGSSSPKTGLSGVSLKSPPAIIRSIPMDSSESARNRSRSTAIRRLGSDSAAPPYLDGWWFTSTATFAESF